MIKSLTKMLLVASVTILLASCTGIKDFKQDIKQPLTPDYQPQDQGNGTVLNSQGIDYGTKYYTYLNPDYDPYQKFNRIAFYFNYDLLDSYILKPLAVFNYNYVSPDVQAGLVNFYSYLQEPMTLISNAITHQPQQAANNLKRIIFNGIFGLGVIDWASEMGIYSNYNNFNYVLASYGYRTGGYLMIPAYGPTYPRQLIGKTLIQGASSYLAYYNIASLTPYTLPLSLYSVIAARTALLGQDHMIDGAPDAYAITKSVYTQNANFNQARALNQSPPQPDQPILDEDILNSVN